MSRMSGSSSGRRDIRAGAGSSNRTATSGLEDRLTALSRQVVHGRVHRHRGVAPRRVPSERACFFRMWHERGRACADVWLYERRGVVIGDTARSALGWLPYSCIFRLGRSALSSLSCRDENEMSQRPERSWSVLDKGLWAVREMSSGANGRGMRISRQCDSRRARIVIN